jgi:uncharacterized protein (DUF983 family)
MIIHQQPSAHGTRIGPWSAIWRGFLGRCPKCGEGRLFRAYLKSVDTCEKCAEPLGSIRADDGPAWLTILAVGHVVVGLALYVEINFDLPLWGSVTLFAGAALLSALIFLPRAKGIFIGAIWAMKAPDSGIGGD